MYIIYIYTHVYIYIYICVCVLLKGVVSIFTQPLAAWRHVHLAAVGPGGHNVAGLWHGADPVHTTRVWGRLGPQPLTTWDPCGSVGYVKPNET